MLFLPTLRDTIAALITKVVEIVTEVEEAVEAKEGQEIFILAAIRQNSGENSLKKTSKKCMMGELSRPNSVPKDSNKANAQGNRTRPGCGIASVVVQQPDVDAQSQITRFVSNAVTTNSNISQVQSGNMDSSILQGTLGGSAAIGDNFFRAPALADS